MNERIEKLVTAAFPGTSLGVLMMYSPELEKFAELIVRECIWEVVKDDQVPQNIQVLIGERFKEHFGVEE